MISVGNDTMRANEWVRVHQSTQPREVKIDLVDGMDNDYRMTFKKNDEGDYKLNTHGQAYGNFQIKYLKDDIEWMADDGDWEEVVNMINTGLKTITGIKSRK